MATRGSIRKRISRIVATTFLIYFGLLALLFRKIRISDFVRLTKQAREGVDPEDLEYELQEAMYDKVVKTIEAMGQAWEDFSDFFQSLSLVSRIGVCLLGLLVGLFAVLFLYFWLRFKYNFL